MPLRQASRASRGELEALPAGTGRWPVTISGPSSPPAQPQLTARPACLPQGWRVPHQAWGLPGRTPFPLSQLPSALCSPVWGSEASCTQAQGQVEREPRQWAASRHLGILCKTEVLLMEGSLGKGLG